VSRADAHAEPREVVDLGGVRVAPGDRGAASREELG
jgi:hypothetical protein